MLENKDHQTAEAREQHLSLLAAALAATVNSIVITDRDGKILWTNPAFSQLTGYTAEEVIGQTPRVLRSGEQGAEFYAQMWSTILSHRVWSGEIINRRKDGSLYAEEMTITPIQSGDGNALHFVAVKQDVTGRKSLEDQLRQAHKMEAVGRLAGGIAHDFNNLLGVIAGYTNMLEGQIGDDTTLTCIAEEIKAAVRSAAALTSQLLAVSRKQLLQPRVLDLNVVVSHTAKLLRRIVGEDIIVSLNLDPDAGSVKVDPGQLQQVIMNLAVNARDAMPKGGSLTIATANTDLDCNGVEKNNFRRAGRYVKLTLSDTGTGMDAQTQQRAFEPFFTTKPQGQGTGLGLATVYGIVKQSGGYVRLFSELGNGTIVEVHLVRVDEEPEVETRQTPSGETRNGTGTILLVEDFLSLRNMVRKGLEMSGYIVISAGNGVEALNVAESYKGVIHLLVTDVIMPGTDGQQLAERIAALRPGISVLYMSGYADEMLGQHGVLSSNVAFIKKPFEMPDLLAKIREALQPTNAGHECSDSPAA